jgi:hypothetical protein
MPPSVISWNAFSVESAVMMATWMVLPPPLEPELELDPPLLELAPLLAELLPELELPQAASASTAMIVVKAAPSRFTAWTDRPIVIRSLLVA